MGGNVLQDLKVFRRHVGAILVREVTELLEVGDEVIEGGLNLLVGDLLGGGLVDRESLIEVVLYVVLVAIGVEIDLRAGGSRSLLDLLAGGFLGLSTTGGHAEGENKDEGSGDETALHGNTPSALMMGTVKVYRLKKIYGMVTG